MTQHNTIKLFEAKKVRTIWDDKDEKWYFSIVDVVAVLTDSPNPRKYWSVLKTRLKKEGSELTTNCSQLKMKSADGIFSVNTLRRTVRLPFCGGYPCRLLTHITPPLFFPFRSVGGGAVVSVFKGSFARGGRIQGFPDKYARSEARGRFIGKRRSRLTF